MAFQAGSRVDPRLLDYSGYAQGMVNASAINAQSLMDLGQKVGDTITKYQEKKEDKRKREGFRPIVDDFVSFTNPDMPEDEREVMAKSIIDNGTLSDLQDLSTTYQMERMKFDYLKDLNQQKIDIEREKVDIASQPKVEMFTGEDVMDARTAVGKLDNYFFIDGYLHKKMPDGTKVMVRSGDPLLKQLKGAIAFLHPDAQLQVMGDDNNIKNTNNISTTGNETFNDELGIFDEDSMNQSFGFDISGV